MNENSKKSEVAEKTIAYMQRAATEFTDSYRESGVYLNEDVVNAEVYNFFETKGHEFFLKDLNRFSTELSEFKDEDDESVWGSYETYIGMALGSMVAAKAGVEIEVLRFKLEHIISPTESIPIRLERYQRAYLGNNADPIIEALPKLFDGEFFQCDYEYGLASALNLGIEISAKPNVKERMLKARRRIAEQQKFLLGDEPLTSAHIELLK